MSDKYHMHLLRLMILCSLLTGIAVAEASHVFCSSGIDVSLPCNNAISDCTKTTWTYNRRLNESTVELVTLGKTKNDRESLGSDCSLKIKKITNEDYGFYTCRQFEHGQQRGTDAHVYLDVLHVSSFSQTEIRPGRSVTLSCQLYHFYGVSCDTLLRFERVQLKWVNQSGVNLKTDSRYQISFSSYHCIITLTTTLLNEDHNRKWKCQLTQRNQTKTSATYTVKAPVKTTDIPVYISNFKMKTSESTAAAPTQAPVITTDIPVYTSNFKMKTSESAAAAPTQGPVDATSENKVYKTVGSLLRVILIIVEIAVFAAPTVILLQIIWSRRAGRKDSLSDGNRNA